MADSSFSSTTVSSVIIAPTFNNFATLADVLERLGQLGLPIIVVNDGSTDRTCAVLESFASIQLRTHSVNRGKAAAMRTGFEAAAQMDFTHAVTIDTDGQHDPRDIPRLLEEAQRSPRSLILGTRARRIAGYPGRNRLGRWISNGLVWLECGLRLDDTQCGLRVYPLSLILSARSAAPRYGFETEIITLAAWMEFPVVQVPVRCTYDVDNGQVSHFQPWRDSLRAVRMHAGLLAASAPRLPLRLARGFHPAAIWRQLRRTPRSRREFAGGLAVGVFCACLPLYGIQAVLSLLGARMMRFNQLSALVGSQLSSPPIGAILIAASMALGHLLLNGSWPDGSAWKMAHASIRPWVMVRTLGLDWALGSLVIGAVLSLITYVAVRAALAFGRPHAGLDAGIAGIGGAAEQLIEPNGAKAAVMQSADQLAQSPDSR